VSECIRASNFRMLHARLNWYGVVPFFKLRKRNAVSQMSRWLMFPVLGIIDLENVESELRVPD